MIVRVKTTGELLEVVAVADQIEGGVTVATGRLYWCRPRGGDQAGPLMPISITDCDEVPDGAL